MKIPVFISVFLFSAFAVFAQTISYVTVKTTAPENKNLKVHYRVPKNFSEGSGRLYRVLVLFGGRNCNGENLVKGNMVDFADENDIVTVAPSFKDDDYWEPEKWSGRALLTALKEIEKKYPIRVDRIMYCGYSAGSQASNLFAAWKPEICIAWASHGCGVWQKPSKKMQSCSGLATCGEADIGRYELTRRFAMEARKKGMSVIWKSFPNTPHEVHPDAVKLTKVFFKYHNESNAADLLPERKRDLAKFKPEAKYIGDDQEGRFWPAGSRDIRNIEIEDRVEFCCKELAEAWGREARVRN